MRNYIAYATNLFQKGASEVVLKAMGRAINKTVTIAEIIKRRIPGLHQNTAIDSTPITEVWEPMEEGLERVETTRLVSSIQITLSSGQLDVNSPGYQPPLPEDQIRNVSPDVRGARRGGFVRRGTRGLRRGRGGPPPQAVQDQINPPPIPLPNPGFQGDQIQSNEQPGLRRPPRTRGKGRMGLNQNTNNGNNTSNNIHVPPNIAVNNFNNQGYNPGFNPGYNNTGFNSGYNSGYNPNFNSGFRGRGRGRGRGGRGRGRGGRGRGQFMGFNQNQPRGNMGFRNNMMSNPANIPINQKSPSPGEVQQENIILP
jgi:DNA-binding protein Alba